VVAVSLVSGTADHWAVILQLVDDEPVRDTDGSWSLSGFWSRGSARAILSDAPGTWVSLAYVEDEMIDGTGEAVDLESTSGLEIARDALAMFAWTDHWQAGLHATLQVFSSLEELDRAAARASSDLREPPDGAEEHGE
jgi:hypothetical protein